MNQSDAQAAPQSAPEPSSDAELVGPVGRAVAVAREIEADPGDLDAILDRHGLTPESYEDLLYEISSDPELSKAYIAELGL